MPTATAKPAESKALTKPQQAAEFVRAGLMERLPAILPEDMPVDRFVGLTLQVLARTPALADADRTSFLLALLDAARDHLEPTGSAGGAHLVTFKGKDGVARVQMIHDYRGTQTLIRRGGGGEVKAVAVFEGDDFEVFEGTGNPRIEHHPKYLTRNPAECLFIYAWPLNDPAKFEVMTRGDVDAIRAKSRAANNGPWVTDWVQMGRKTAIKRLANYLELRPDVRESLERDTEREFGQGDAPVVVNAGNARVRGLLAARGVIPAETPTDAPGAPEEPPPPDDAAPAVVVCDATSDPALGAVESCVLPEKHKEPHRSFGGSTWPSKG